MRKRMIHNKKQSSQVLDLSKIVNCSAVPALTSNGINLKPLSIN